MPTFDLSPAVAAERLTLFLNSHGVGFNTLDGLDAVNAADCTALGYPGVPFPSGESLGQARRLRTLLLRSVGSSDGFAQRELNDISKALPWVYHFAADGVAVPMPTRDALTAWVLGDFAVVAAAQQWDRIKVCANEECKALFFDTTKARARRWHSFKQCGNKANVAAHRQRQSDGT